MPKILFISSVTASLIALCASADAAGLKPSKSTFFYKDASGKERAAEIVRKYQPQPIVQPFATVDRRINPRLLRAATIAEERSHARTRRRCWAYVKQALLASGVIDSRPQTAYARDAGEELVRNYGFKRLAVTDPYAAPVGSVLVYYKGPKRPGHVEIRTRTGFVSDYRTKTPSPHRLLGVFAKS